MNPRVARTVRRGLVTVGVIGSLALGVLTIRAAAAWTAAEAPLAAPPVAIATLQGALAAERERAAQLEASLAEITARTSELAAAVDAATGRVAADAEAAAMLRERLAAATSRLADLDRQAAARAAFPATAVVAPARADRDEPDGSEDDGESHDDD